MALATLTDEESVIFSVKEIDGLSDFFDLLSAFDLADKKFAAESVSSTIGATNPGANQGAQLSAG